MFNTANGGRKRSTSMSEGNTKVWESFENTTKNHGANCQRCFSRHTNKPWQPIALHLFLSHHIPGMYKNGGTQLRCSFEKRKKFWCIEVPVVDMTSNLNTSHSNFHASFQFSNCQLRIL